MAQKKSFLFFSFSLKHFLFLVFLVGFVGIGFQSFSEENDLANVSSETATADGSIPTTCTVAANGNIKLSSGNILGLVRGITGCYINPNTGDLILEADEVDGNLFTGDGLSEDSFSAEQVSMTSATSNTDTITNYFQVQEARPDDLNSFLRINLTNNKKMDVVGINIPDVQYLNAQSIAAAPLTTGRGYAVIISKTNVLSEIQENRTLQANAVVVDSHGHEDVVELDEFIDEPVTPSVLKGVDQDPKAEKVIARSENCSEKKVIEIFKGLRNVIFLLSAFSLLAFVVMALMGKLSFEWVGINAVVLMIVLVIPSLIRVITGIDLDNFKCDPIKISKNVSAYTHANYQWANQSVVSGEWLRNRGDSAAHDHDHDDNEGTSHAETETITDSVAGSSSIPASALLTKAGHEGQPIVSGIAHFPGLSWSQPVSDARIRVRDSNGCGCFGASRSGGARQHKGIDVVAESGQPVYSPIDGYVSSTSGLAYGLGKKSKSGGSLDEYTCFNVKSTTVPLYQVKMCYVKAIVMTGTHVKKGDQIGVMQNLQVNSKGQKVYPSITNHIHLELKQDGRFVDPATLVFEGGCRCV